MTPFLRTEFNYDMLAESNKTGIFCDPSTPDGKSMTQQHFKEECDINTIVERFGLTGHMPHVERLPSYGDFTGVFDYQTAMNAIVAARETFDTLPANIRARFHNDPHEFVDFCEATKTDEIAHREAVKMGLIELPEDLHADTPAPDLDKTPTLAAKSLGDDPAKQKPAKKERGTTPSTPE